MAAKYWNGKEWIDLASGEQGPQGPAGNGISSAVLNADYTLTLNFTNGSSYTTPSIRGEQGEQGPQGEDGADGADGVGIASITLVSGTHAAGTLDTYRVTLTDGNTYDFQVYNGADGQGSPGSQTPKHLGTGSAGTANAYAREDHVHPGFVELWSNPNPSSNFNAQTISLDLSAWSVLCVTYITATGQSRHASTIVFKDGETYFVTVGIPSTSNNYYYKRGASADNTGVTFTNGYQNTTAGASYAVPQKIYGVC
jgi:hypothetical protein